MWLLEFNTKVLIEQAEAQNTPIPLDEQAKLTANFEASLAGATPRIMSVAGDKAQIAVEGVLTKVPSWLAMIFGGGNTTYPEIISAIAAAEQDDNISDMTLAIDSPGGHFDGLFDVLGAIRAAKKPVHAQISSLGASAAFAIATEADTIAADNKATRVGSVGVAATFRISENEVTITSTDAPKKRPDVTTDEGKADVRQELDAMHEIFADAIAAGRSAATGEKFTTARVNKDFGRGATLLAGEALKQGMIDNISSEGSASAIGATSPTVASVQPNKIQAQLKTTKKTEVKVMDLVTLKAEHPAVFAAAKAEGVTAERDRVSAHLIMGEASGDMVSAIAAAKDGSEMSAAIQATHFSASMKKKDIDARDKDNIELKVETKPGEPSAADIVAAEVEAALGVEGGTV